MTQTSFHLLPQYTQTQLVTAHADALRLIKNRYGHLPEQPEYEMHYNVVQTIYRIRQLTLKFTPHYHPWVRELTQQLLRKSTHGLMDTDTEYRTPVVALAAQEGKRPDESLETIPIGGRVEIPDGTIVLRPDGTQLRLAGRHVVAVAADDKPEVKTQLARGAALSVPKDATVLVRGVAVKLDGTLTAQLIHDGPVPAYFRDFFADTYLPNVDLAPAPYPVDDLDFTIDGGYSVYNWELFFHIPLTLATHLSQNGQYEDAIRWFHYVFDPTDDSAQLAPERYWKVKPFQTTDVEQIESILTALSANPGAEEATVNAINAWRNNPFRPHLVARYRPSAYMYKTVMAYLDNLIAWGDSLFRQDTGEAIDEALQLYVLAANVLGPRPQAVPDTGSVPPQTYMQLRSNLDPFSNALRDFEGALLFDGLPRAEDQGAEEMVVLNGIGKSLYFGVPHNDKLLGYWNTVADRLFKIRNSLNIEGVFRRLALFEPPIDPAMLARAAAAGLSPSDAMNASANLTPVRFQPLLRQATELAQQVASLGQNLLSAMEKEDGEAIALLRSQHEQKTAELATQVRYGQVQEATKAKEGVAASINSALLRHIYYERLLGRDASTIKIPELDEIDRETLATQSLKMVEPTPGARDVPVDIASGLQGDASGRYLNRQEAVELEKLAGARAIQEAVKDIQLAGQLVALLPELGIDFHFWGIGGRVAFGGSALSRGVQMAADVKARDGDHLTYEAGGVAKMGSYARREQEWAQQSNLALAEIAQLHKQLRGAQVREAVAQTELANHLVQVAQLAEMNLFLNAEGKSGSNRKATNKALYTWNKREVRSLYNRVYKLAYEAAVSAQATLEHELGEAPKKTIVQSGHMGGKEGLLAGEKLLLDLKQLEDYYLRNNKRQLEVVRHVSLAQLNPLALLKLRTTGACSFDVPEEWYDLEGPSHYDRRIRSVTVTIPCLTGPLTSVNCRVTLSNSTVRKEPNVESREKQVGVVDAIVASSAQQDSGVMDAGGEQWRPFELYGAAGTWSLELPGSGTDGIRTFDYDSISDVVLTVRFTVKADGTLRNSVVDRLHKRLKGEDGGLGSARLFSLRHEFPGAWAHLKTAEGDETSVTMTFEKPMFPYWLNSVKGPKISKVDFFEAPNAAQEGDLVAVADAGNDNPEFGKEWTTPQLPTKAKDVWVLAAWEA